jgi:O-antigen/teichoic acid export membrane protein
MILMIATLGVLLINNRILVYLFGGDFRQAVSYTPILMVAASILFYSNYFGPIFSSVQKSKTLMTTTFAGTVVNIVLNMILIRLWGIYGACIATLVSNAVVSISRICLSRRIYLFTIDWKTFMIGWFFLMIACIATLFVGKYAEAIDGLLIVFTFIMYKSHLQSAFEQIKQRLKGKIA